jgi:hypothetical protein
MYSNEFIKYKPIDDLPNGLIRLDIMEYEFKHPLNNLPPTLEILYFRTGNMMSYCDGYKYKLSNLPAGLKMLYHPEFEALDDDDNCQGIDLENLPQNLKVLCIPKSYHTYINLNNLPDSIEYLNVDSNYTVKYDEIYTVDKLPAKLKCFSTNCERFADYMKNKFPDIHIKIEGYDI